MPRKNRMISLSDLPFDLAYEERTTAWFTRFPSTHRFDDLRDAVRKALDALPPREREVIERRFGFDRPEETLESIGRSINLSREGTRQLVSRALVSLKTQL
jgi:RNA polymerase sigma factor (sigma-70 family)